MLAAQRYVIAMICCWILAGCALAQVPRGPIMLDAPEQTITASIDRDAVLEDLQMIDETVRAMVPDGTVLPGETALAAERAARVAQLPPSASRRQVAAAAMEQAGAYRSSHVYLLFPFENWNIAAAQGGRQLDRALSMTRDGLLLIDQRAVTTINDRPARDFLAWARKGYGQDNPLCLLQRVRDRGAEMLWLWGIDAPFRIAFADGTEASFEGAPMAQQTNPLGGRASEGESKQPAPQPFSLEVEDGIAQLKVERLDQRFEQQWRTLVVDLEAGIRQGRITRLIIDLRGNRGGAGRLSERLLAMLAGVPVSTSGGKLWKHNQIYEDGLADFVPPVLRLGPWRRAILGSGGVAALDSIPLGETRLFGGFPRPTVAPIMPEANISVLIDQDTGSSATQLARAMQFFRLGRLIGAPTANPTTELGEIAFFRLPNSQLIFASPSAQFLDVSGEPTEGPVMPDILLYTHNGLFAAESALERRGPELDFIFANRVVVRPLHRILLSLYGDIANGFVTGR